MNAVTKMISVCGLWGLAMSPTSLILGQEATEAAITKGDAATVAVSTETGVNPQSPTARVSSAEVAAAPKSPRRSSAGRLPPYFASLVDSQQRAAIYKIRAAMSEKISALELQLEELRQAEMREIEGVLSDDQRQRLETLRAARAQQPQPLGT